MESDNKPVESASPKQVPLSYVNPWAFDPLGIGMFYEGTADTSSTDNTPNDTNTDDSNTTEDKPKEESTKKASEPVDDDLEDDDDAEGDPDTTPQKGDSDLVKHLKNKLKKSGGAEKKIRQERATLRQQVSDKDKEIASLKKDRDAQKTRADNFERANSTRSLKDQLREVGVTDANLDKAVKLFDDSFLKEEDKDGKKVKVIDGDKFRESNPFLFDGKGGSGRRGWTPQGGNNSGSGSSSSGSSGNKNGASGAVDNFMSNRKYAIPGQQNNNAGKGDK